jgi:hypothetical protein
MSAEVDFEVVRTAVITAVHVCALVVADPFPADLLFAWKQVSQTNQRLQT